MPFGELDIILVGDLCQLSPVFKRPSAKWIGDKDQRKDIWKSLIYYPFIQIMRQKNVEFSTLLTKIGDGRKLTEQEITFFESRFINISEVEEKCSNALRLFHDNKSVGDFNNVILKIIIYKFL